MTDEHHADGAPRRSSWGARLRAAPLVYNGMVLLALSGLALAQPVFDLFGRNPEFFVASGATKTEIVAFALLIALAPATVGLALEAGAYAISARAGSVVHLALMTGLALVLGLVVAHNIGIGRSLVFVAVAAVVGGLIVVGERRYSPVRQALRYLAAAPFAFLALILFGSESASLVWADEARAEAGVTIGNPAPIVMVVLDELPTSSLMKPDGSIDEERFPNFARLAESSHWYRNATSVAPQTTESVPSGVTGVIPEERQIPTSATHPRSLFTLLGGAYEMNVIEEVTEVCPSSVCSEGAESSVGDFFSSLPHTIVDTSIVYGHVVLPPRLREELPSVGGTWAGFIDQADAGAGAGLSGAAGDVQGFIDRAVGRGPLRAHGRPRRCLRRRRGLPHPVGRQRARDLQRASVHQGARPDRRRGRRHQRAHHRHLAHDHGNHRCGDRLAARWSLAAG